MANTKKYAGSDRDGYDPDDPVVNPRDLVDPSEQAERPARKRVNARRQKEFCGTYVTTSLYNAPRSDGRDPLLKRPAQGLALDTMPRPLRPPGRTTEEG
jgi:hypothetical protein